MLGNPDFYAVIRARADGCLVQCRKCDAGNTAGVQGDCCSALSLGRKYLSHFIKKESVIDARLELLEVPNPHEFQQAGRADDILRAKALIEAQQPSGGGEPSRISQKVAVEDVSRLPHQPGSPVVLLDLRSSAFNDSSVLHSRRAGSLTRSAVETA